jgi:hypothetical protein
MQALSPQFTSLRLIGKNRPSVSIQTKGLEEASVANSENAEQGDQEKAI